MRRFTEMVGDEMKEQAVDDAMAWGYPRPVTLDELDVSVFVRHGSDIVFWYNGCPGPEDLMLHLCLAPELQGRLRRYELERLEAGWEVIAEILGADRLWASGGELMNDYCARRGWCHTDDGRMVYQLGEG